jgi:hypothetical protein
VPASGAGYVVRFALHKAFADRYPVKTVGASVHQELPLRKGWESAKDNVMREALRAKFTQHADLRALLLGTDDATLVEHTEKDDYWGDGGNGSGKNRLGQLLMELREQLRAGQAPALSHSFIH